MKEKAHIPRYKKNSGLATLILTLCLTIAISVMGFVMYESSKAVFKTHQVNAQVFQSESETWAGVEIFRRYLDERTPTELLALNNTPELAIQISGVNSNLVAQNVVVKAEQVVALGADYIVTADLVREKVSGGATVLRAQYLVDKFANLPTLSVSQPVSIYEPTTPASVVPPSTPSETPSSADGSGACSPETAPEPGRGGPGDSVAIGKVVANNGQVDACITTSGSPETSGTIDGTSTVGDKESTISGEVTGNGQLGVSVDTVNGTGTSFVDIGPGGGAGFVTTTASNADGSNATITSQHIAFHPADQVTVLDEGALEAQPALNNRRPIFNARPLAASADYVVSQTVNSASVSQIIVTANSVSGITDGDYYLGSFQDGAYATANALCESVNLAGECTTAPVADFCETLDPLESCISYDADTAEIVLKPTELLPGSIHFKDSVRFESGFADPDSSHVFLNSLISEGDVSIDENVAIKAVNLGSYDELCQPAAYPGDEFFTDFTASTAFCDFDNELMIYQNIGNLSVAAGSYDENMVWIGGNVELGEFASLEGTLLAGGFLDFDDEAAVVGSLVALGNMSSYSSVTSSETTITDHQVHAGQISEVPDGAQNYNGYDIPAYTDLVTMVRHIEIIGTPAPLPGIAPSALYVPPSEYSVDKHRETARIMWTTRL